MSGNAVAVKNLEQLEAEMELAFRAGDQGETALLAWEAVARFPANGSVARIYIKKILRDPYVANITLEAFKDNAKELRQTAEPEELARLSALGLLRFPAQRYLSLSLLEAAQQLDRKEWMQPLIESLGPPGDDDVVLLNVVASYENIMGNYQRAALLFKKLLDKEPNNDTILQNYSASLTGLEQYDDAIALLVDRLPGAEEPRAYLNRLLPLYRFAGLDVERELNALDSRLFARCDTSEAARVHADLRLFLCDWKGAARGLEQLLSYEWRADVAFELAEVQLTLGELDDGLKGYGVRFEAFPDLAWYKTNAKKYKGETLDDEPVFVWAEQGIGDEIVFAMFLEVLAHRIKNLVVALDARLVPSFAQRFPEWRFVDRQNLPTDLPIFDYACPMGDLMVQFLPALLEKQHRFIQPTIQPDRRRYEKIQSLMVGKTKPRIAISWRGGREISREIRSMELGKMMLGLPEDADVEVISLQYDGEHEQEVKDHGDRRLALSGLNNRFDLEGVFALIRCCDVVITVDNAVAHFASALGVPCAVLVSTALPQFRWNNEGIKDLLFPSATLFPQKTTGRWEEPVAAAWQYALQVAHQVRLEEVERA